MYHFFTWFISAMHLSHHFFWSFYVWAISHSLCSGECTKTFFLSDTDYLTGAGSTVCDTFLTKWLLLMIGSSMQMMTLYMYVWLHVKDDFKWWTETFQLRNYLLFVSPFNFAFFLNSAFTLDITWSPSIRMSCLQTISQSVLSSTISNARDYHAFN